jgi:four helix bundle protein
MGTGFHDLQVWRKAKALAVTICTTTANLRDLSLRDQIRRSAVSVPSNITEGDERDTGKDSIRFFYIAKGSLAELCTQIEIAMEVGLIPPQTAESILSQAAVIGRKLGALIKARTSHTL